ncbi:MAG: GyrI-like domain-containing protein [Bacteroidota bacterium]
MKKPIRSLLLLALVITGIWYFGLKKEHYQISFTTKQPPAIVFNQIKKWQGTKESGITSVNLYAEQRHSAISQTVQVGDSIFNFDWNFYREDDSTTKVDVKITDKKHWFSQKMQVPFSKNDFVKRSIRTVKVIGAEMVVEAKKFKVHSITDTIFEKRFCVFLPLKSAVNRKASTMLYSIGDLMGYINENEIELQGDPYLEVTEWDEEAGTIAYNFCFPIAKSDTLPASDIVLFKESPSFRAIKAEFNGNYAIANKAWYYLLEYAERNQLKVKHLPTELYLDDPQSGGDAMNWTAHIYLPLADE